MFIVPVQSVPNQEVLVVLGGQTVQVNIYQKKTGLFMDVLVSNAVIVCGVVCQNLNRIVRDAYLGFIGDFVWLDTQGSEDPVAVTSLFPGDIGRDVTGFQPAGLGTRWLLCYLTANDLSSGTVGIG